MDNNNKRIAKNTFFLYFRQLFSLFISIYTSRVVFNALGAEDYGINNVIGGFVTIFAFASNSLISGAQRFLSYQIGKNDNEKLVKTFYAIQTSFYLIAFSIFIISEFIGIWFINNHLVVPENRQFAANWVFQASLISFIIGITTVPYNAAIIAHEKMSFFAYIGILETSLKLIIALLIQEVQTSDTLIFYISLFSAISLIIRIASQLYCKKNFIECRTFRLSKSKEFITPLLSYSGYNMIGTIAIILKNQGSNILLNLFFGPIVNAARGISVQIYYNINQFLLNLYMATRPQIVKYYAKEEYIKMWVLVEKSTKLSFYLILAISLPFFLNTKEILYLWLGEYPDNTILFTILLLISMLVEAISAQIISVFQAANKIKQLQLVGGSVLILNIPISLLFLYNGYASEYIFYVNIFVQLIYTIVIVIIGHNVISLKYLSFLKNVILPIIFVVGIISISTYYLSMIDNSSFVIIVTKNIFNELILAFTVLFIGISVEERNFIYSLIKNRFVYGRNRIKRHWKNN